MRRFAVLLVLALAACGGVDRPNNAQFPPENFVPWTPVSEEYRLRPGDEIDVKLLYNPELSDRVMIAPDGRINLPMAGQLIAEGRTPRELAQELETRFAVELQRPDVTVIARSFASQRVFVGGEVVTPGIVAMPGRIGTMEAVMIAGGFKPTAGTDNVIIVRRGPDQRPMLRSVDLSRLLNQGDPSQDVPLMPFDMVFVPRSGIANVNLWVEQYIKNVMPWTTSAGFTANYDMRKATAGQ